MTANQLDQRASVDHFRLGLLLAVGSALAFGSSGPFAKALMEAGWSPTAAVVARLAGGALVMAVFATIVRPGWVREALRHTKTVVAVRRDPDRRRAALLLQRGRAPVRRRRTAAGVHRADPRRRLGLDHHAAQADQPDARRCRLGGGRNHVGAQRVQRRSHQPHRRRLGAGRSGVRRVLLRDVGQRQQRLRRQRGRQPHHPGRGWSGGRRRGGHAAGRRRHHAADVHDQRHRHRGVDHVVGGSGRRAGSGGHRGRLHARHHGHLDGCVRGSPHWSACPR